MRENCTFRLSGGRRAGPHRRASPRPYRRGGDWKRGTVERPAGAPSPRPYLWEPGAGDRLRRPGGRGEILVPTATIAAAHYSRQLKSIMRWSIVQRSTCSAFTLLNLSNRVRLLVV